MGLLNTKVLPDNLDDLEDWTGTDDDTPLMRWRLRVKYWFAFSARPFSPQGLDLTVVLFPGLYILPFSIWFTGFSWWYFFPLLILPVFKQWRYMPMTIAGYYGNGWVRYESDEHENGNSHAGWIFWHEPFVILPTGARIPGYISRVQYWCRWHVALHWPLLITAHLYPNAGNVLKPGERGQTDGKVYSFYRGWHRDGDRLYWGDGAAGPNFK